MEFMDGLKVKYLKLILGLDVKVVQTVLSSAFHFVAYEKIVTIILDLMKTK
jgi:hypothetical protein